MKATDLRIGNLFYYRVVDQLDERKEWFEVSEIDYDDLRVIGIKDEMNQDYQPIPLTEEWLLKFGFERHHSDYGNGVIYIKDVPNNNEFKWGVYPFELGSGFIINKSKNLKYVHQLQNLYFALTNEELTMK
jgi:hypothetical protein